MYVTTLPRNLNHMILAKTSQVLFSCYMWIHGSQVEQCIAYQTNTANHVFRCCIGMDEVIASYSLEKKHVTCCVEFDKPLPILSVEYDEETYHPNNIFKKHVYCNEVKLYLLLFCVQIQIIFCCTYVL